MRRPRSTAQTAVSIEALDAAAGKFWARVDMRGRDECWLWTRGVTGAGYGSFALPGALSPTGSPLHVGTHRIAWMLEHRKHPPTWAVIDHLCGNRTCCNPRHLEPVAQSINSVRAGLIGRGFKCAQPKPYTAKDGTVTWRVRFRKYRGRGEIVQGSKTFKSEAEALGFIAENPWIPDTEQDIL
jgi:hypothetical protein